MSGEDRAAERELAFIDSEWRLRELKHQVAGVSLDREGSAFGATSSGAGSVDGDFEERLAAAAVPLGDDEINKILAAQVRAKCSLTPDPEASSDMNAMFGVPSPMLPDAPRPPARTSRPVSRYARSPLSPSAEQTTEPLSGLTFAKPKFVFNPRIPPVSALPGVPASAPLSEADQRAIPDSFGRQPVATNGSELGLQLPTNTFGKREVIAGDSDRLDTVAGRGASPKVADGRARRKIDPEGRAAPIPYRGNSAQGPSRGFSGEAPPMISTACLGVPSGVAGVAQPSPTRPAVVRALTLPIPLKPFASSSANSHSCEHPAAASRSPVQAVPSALSFGALPKPVVVPHAQSLGSDGTRRVVPLSPGVSLPCLLMNQEPLSGTGGSLSPDFLAEFPDLDLEV